MKKIDTPSQRFVGAILRGYDKEAKSGEVTCSGIWDQVVMECFGRSGAFQAMFEWDTSKAQTKNRIGTIAECIRRGHVPGLRLSYDDKRQEVVVTE